MLRPLLLLLLLLSALLAGAQAAGTHSMRYFDTGVSAGTEVPEYTSVRYVDEEQIDCYDSVSQRAEPRQPWMAESQGAVDWELETKKRQGDEQWFKVKIQILQQQINQSGGIHTFQRMYGCELRSDGSTAGLFQFGWDGEDFISFDKEHMVWVTPVPWGLLTKHEWEQNTRCSHRRAYLEDQCFKWLRKFVKAGQSQLIPVQPEVSIFLSADGGRVSCFTTGFYPSSIEVNLVRDGLVLDESRSHGTLPNHDGTFQQHRWADVEPGDTTPLSCRVDHPGLSEPLEVFLDRKSGSTVMIIVLVLVVLVLAVAAVVGGVLFWKKKQAGKSGYNPTQTTERGENSSNSSAPA